MSKEGPSSSATRDGTESLTPLLQKANGLKKRTQNCAWQCQSMETEIGRKLRNVCQVVPKSCVIRGGRLCSIPTSWKAIGHTKKMRNWQLQCISLEKVTGTELPSMLKGEQTSSADTAGMMLSISDFQGVAELTGPKKKMFNLHKLLKSTARATGWK